LSKVMVALVGFVAIQSLFNQVCSIELYAIKSRFVASCALNPLSLAKFGAF
jgi:hypothetical protein